jgi:choline dehydrogenase-like flavoprotein
VGVYNGRCRVLGGTTTRWGGQILEIDEHVFRERPGLPGGHWPFQKQELESAYVRALDFEGLQRAQADPSAIWRDLNLAPPDYGDQLSSAFSRWCPVTNFARLHQDTLRRQPGLTLYLHANVCELLLAPNGETVIAVKTRTLTGTHLEFRAKAFVLAMGGIETCRLLLQPTTSPGLAPWAINGLVGQHYQDHISSFVATVVEGALSASNYFDYLSLSGFKYHPKIKLRPKTQARLGTLDVCGTIALTTDGVDDVAMAYETLRFWQARQLRSLTPRRVAHFAFNAHKLLWHRIPYTRRSLGLATRSPVLRLSVHCEQSPLSEGSISLGTERDALGLLRARVRWCASALELHSIRSFLNTVRESFQSRGLGRIISDPGVEQDDGILTSTFQESFHHLGGTRMATGPSDGVVDPSLRIFGTSNAYVCSTSVFPSAGFPNPTHTLIALAVRLAKHLNESATL